MSERTPVEFTQAGKRITFSAGYIIGICPFAMTALGQMGQEIRLGCGLITNLGIVFVDQEKGEALHRWEAAIRAPEDYTTRLQRVLSTTALGNNAEF